MSTDKHGENLSFDDIDEILEPLTQICLDNVHPDALKHLREQLGLIAHLVGLRIEAERFINDDHR